MLSSGNLTLVMTHSTVPPAAPSPEVAQAAGFHMGGEPLAVDLADTVVTTLDPPADLLADVEACERFWAFQSPRLPDGWEVPSLPDTRELRDAIRQLLDATHASVRLDTSAMDVVNRASGRASTTLEAAQADSGLVCVRRWITADPAALPLAAAARSAIEILTDASTAGRLRRCANPACSMLFINGDARRQWCTPNICGNRARVARHYRRHRPPA
jgi:predicted RNA-binding Zn ribbon-like protein